MSQEIRNMYAFKSYEGAGGSGQYRERERRPGHYVRHPRAEYEYQPKQSKIGITQAIGRGGQNNIGWQKERQTGRIVMILSLAQRGRKRL